MVLVIGLAEYAYIAHRQYISPGSWDGLRNDLMPSDHRGNNVGIIINTIIITKTKSKGKHNNINQLGKSAKCNCNELNTQIHAKK